MWSPIGAGDGRPSHHTFTTDSGAFPLTGLSGSNIALHMEDIYNNNQLYICTGTWTITGTGSSTVPGKADFTPSVADLSTGYLGVPGLYKVYPVVTLSTGPTPMDSQVLQVVSLP